MGYGDHKQLSFYDGCIMTYGKATRLMGEVWEKVIGEPMPTLSGSPTSRFEQALAKFEGALQGGSHPGLKSGLKDAAASDPVLSSFIDESLQSGSKSLPPAIDDVPPTVFKRGVFAEASARGKPDRTIDVNLDDFLRGVVGLTVKEMKWGRRFNVGTNQHFPRMWQWLREVEDETAYDEGYGIRIMNRNGGGRVAAEPDGPHGLKVRINAEFL